MWAIGVYDFGLDPKAVLRLTPAQFFALSKRKDINRRMDDYPSAIVARTIAEINRDKKKRTAPYQAEEFLPKYGPQKKENLSGKMLLAKWQADVLPYFKVIDMRSKEDASNG